MCGTERVDFRDLPGWQDDDQRDAFLAFRRSALRNPGEKPLKTGDFGIATADLEAAYHAARQHDALTDLAARDFFERHFQPVHIRKAGFVTGFYEPVIKASRHRSADFRYPFHRRPHDLVAVDETNRPAMLDPSMAFARRAESDGCLSAYPDRRAIETGFLDGRGLEIAWCKSRIDVFLAHVQGAARLELDDGETIRITYDGKSGHAFTAIGRVLVEKGELDPQSVTMDAIRDWLDAHPDRHDEILWQNRSYIFFRQTPPLADTLGPIAAAKVPLTPGRSLAVDRRHHTFSSPFYVTSDALADPDHAHKPFRRLMIAQDTGSAILGEARGDLFIGSGSEAGKIAGAIRHQADFFLLVPFSAIDRFPS